MAIKFTIKNTESMLKVKAIGKDDNLQDVETYGMAIVQAAISTGARKILCDETELQYALSTFDSFESAKFIAEMAPKIAKIAIVCKEDQFLDAAFWETVAVNRGLKVSIFKNLMDAEAWLG